MKEIECACCGEAKDETEFHRKTFGSFRVNGNAYCKSCLAEGRTPKAPRLLTKRAVSNWANNVMRGVRASDY
jgi:late competence protein required for DNA uptake (superfamily II DNA/RNA helicase)